jgi:hypothetical protein
MSTFKEFMEIRDVRGFAGGNLGKSSKRTAQGGEPYVTTGDVSKGIDILMSPRRRQMIDVDEPGQKYFYFITLTRALIADTDTGKLIAGTLNDPFKVVYTPNEMTHHHYPPEEQKRIEELKIFIWTKGYDHDELIHIIGNDLDKIEKFRLGQLFDPRKYNELLEKEGWFVDYERLSQVRDELDKWLKIQGTLERGKNYLNSTLFQQMRQGAAQNKLAPSPTVTYT